KVLPHWRKKFPSSASAALGMAVQTSRSSMLFLLSDLSLFVSSCLVDRAGAVEFKRDEKRQEE
ncbi:MAG: hypothetical protein V4462_06940, partial [Pseudomonadota bacterium]